MNINKIKLSGTTYSIQDENATKTVELTQAQYDALTVKDPNTFYVITDAQGADLSNYYTKSETSGATEISTALNAKADTATTYTKTETDNAITAATSTKQDTLVSGTNIKTINNESILGSGNIDIQGGGGKAVSGGTNISVTTGETADTINCTLPITKNSYNNGVTLGWNGNNSKNYFAVAEGYNSIASGGSSHAEGYATTAETQGSHSEGYSTIAGFTIAGYNQEYCHAEGYETSALTYFSHAEGYQNKVQGQASHAEGVNNEIINPFGNYAQFSLVGSHAEGKNNKTYNEAEHASGKFNNSVSASTTFGDSGNTLFSVGNGTADNARHNAFEIRQNGDIYLTKDGQDVKLQDQLGGGGSSYTAGDGIDITNDVISVTGKVDTSTYNTYTAATDTALASKQDTLVSGTNIKTINNESILGSGNITIEGGGMDDNTQQLISTALVDLNDRKADKSLLGDYQKKGDYANKSDLDAKANTSDVMTLEKSTNNELVTASALNNLNHKFGGLSLVKITESAYAALTTKDENVLYIVVADPS